MRNESDVDLNARSGNSDEQADQMRQAKTQGVSVQLP
jgi:hypothetical protein